MTKANWMVLGAGDKAHHCAIACRKGLGGMHELVLCNLKPPYDCEIGSQTVDDDAIEGIAYHICFAKRESLVAFIKAAQKMLEDWDDNNTRT